MRNIYLIGVLFLLSSCARILNGPLTKVTIVTDTTAKVVFNKDTLPENTVHKIKALRSKDSLRFTVLQGDSLKKAHSMAAITSAAFYLNINTLNLYGLGFILDRKSSKIYTYPQKIWVKNQQAYDYYHKNPDFDFENIIKITPLKFIDFSHAALDISYEKKLNKSATLNINSSVLLPYSPYKIKSSRGFNIGVEPRYYFKQNAPFKSYIALETAYFNAGYDGEFMFNKKDSYTYYEHENYKYWDYEASYSENISIRKTALNINLKYGYQHRFPKRILVDVYAGIGARLRSVRHLNKTFPEDPLLRTRHPNIHYINNQEGKYWVLSIPLNFKIGYSF